MRADLSLFDGLMDSSPVSIFNSTLGNVVIRRRIVRNGYGQAGAVNGVGSGSTVNQAKFQQTVDYLRSVKQTAPEDYRLAMSWYQYNQPSVFKRLVRALEDGRGGFWTQLFRR